MAPSSNPRSSRSGGEASQSRATVWRASLGYRPDLLGEYPGQECVLTLPETRAPMTLCWCPPSEDMPGFWIAKHLVSQFQWEAVMGSNPSRSGKGPDHPVDSVSWEDAMDFCRRCRLRLPSESKWEYACRAGTDKEFALGVGGDLNAQQANFDGNEPEGSGRSAFRWVFRKRTIIGGFFPPNAWGIHDMHGQLWEWCEGEMSGERRVLRGGSFVRDGWPRTLGARRSNRPTARGVEFGFRPCQWLFGFRVGESTLGTPRS